MITKFIIKGVSKKFKGVQKLPAQKTPKIKSDINITKDLSVQTKTLRSTFGKDMPKSWYSSPPIISGKQEIALKAARIRETNVLQSKVKSIRKATATKIKSGIKIFGKKSSSVKLFKKTSVWSTPPTKFNPNPPKIKIFKRTPFGALVKRKTDKLTGRAVVISKRRGLIHGERTAKKLGVTFPKGLKEMDVQFTKQTKYWKRPNPIAAKIYRSKVGDPYTKGETITFAKKQARQEKIFQSRKGYFDPQSQSFKWRPKPKKKF